MRSALSVIRRATARGGEVAVTDGVALAVAVATAVSVADAEAVGEGAAV